METASLPPPARQRSPLIVTGLAGLVGSRLQRLAAGRFELIGIDWDGRVGIDLTDPAQAQAAIEPHGSARGVIHLAAFTDVNAAHAQSGDESGSCFRTNVLGTRNLVAACRAAGLPLIHVSTDFVFDGGRDEPYTEADAPAPIEWYGRTKYLAEEEVRRGGASWTIVRIAYPYVAGRRRREDFVSRLVRRLLSGERARLFDDQFTTPTLVDDVAMGLIALASEWPGGETFHLVGSSWITPFEVGLRLVRLFGLDPGLVERGSLAAYARASPGGRPYHRSLKLSNQKWVAWADRRGLAPPIDIDEGLRRVHEAWEEVEV